MGSLSPMDFHQYPSICKVALSYKYFLAIIALQGDFGNKFRKEQPILHCARCNSWPWIL